MFLRANDEHGIGLKHSLVIGDRMMDSEMPHDVGAKGIRALEPENQHHVEKEIRESTTKPESRADTFVQAVDWTLEMLDNRG